MEKEEDRDQCQDSGTGIENKVGSHDTRDSPARPDRRDLRIPICEEMDQTSCDTADEIESEITDVAESIFNVIPEDIKKPHVHDNVKGPSVKKHGRQKREILLEACKVSRDFRIRVSEGHDSVEIKNLIQI